MDFAVTKKKDGLDPNPEGAADDKGALWLVLTDRHTGYLGCIPIQSKGQLHYMTHEVLSFVQGLGYSEVGFYGDNEPSIRQILKTIITSRHALGLKTRIYTTKVKDSAGNALAENDIQRIRQLACTLVEDVCERTGLVFPCEHAIWSWAGRHAAWCLNRYQVGKSLTAAYEVTHGEKYAGKTACFAGFSLCILQRTWEGRCDMESWADAWENGGPGCLGDWRWSGRYAQQKHQKSGSSMEPLLGILLRAPDSQLCLPDQLWWKNRADQTQGHSSAPRWKTPSKDE